MKMESAEVQSCSDEKLEMYEEIKRTEGLSEKGMKYKTGLCGGEITMKWGSSQEKLRGNKVKQRRIKSQKEKWVKRPKNMRSKLMLVKLWTQLELWIQSEREVPEKGKFQSHNSAAKTGWKSEFRKLIKILQQKERVVRISPERYKCLVVFGSREKDQSVNRIWDGVWADDRVFKVNYVTKQAIVLHKWPLWLSWPVVEVCMFVLAIVQIITKDLKARQCSHNCQPWFLYLHRLVTILP